MCLAVVLLVLRMLVPAESSVLGGTLWIVQGWLGLSGLWLWMAARRGTLTLRWSWPDWLFWIVVAGHVCSAAAIVLGQGNRRAAVNMAWEWVALGVSLFLLRQLFVRREDCRDLLALIVILGMSLAGWGIWQHYVWYPKMATQFQTVLDEVDTAPSTGPDGGVERRSESDLGRAERVAELRGQLAASGVSLDTEGQRTLKDRLFSSREPFGPHGLANTFGGLLGLWLILAVGLVRRVPPGERWWDWTGLVWLTGCVLLAYCLLLTKSRTAWIGCLVGGIAAGISLRLAGTASAQRRSSSATRSSSTTGPDRSPGVLLRSSRFWLMLTLVVVALVVLVAGGSLDSQVLSEAGKSLTYRAQYWQATWRMLWTRPLLGAGPGNFRQAYLEFKLPESSEEIVDPHNWVLDVWSSGGLLALFGALGLAAAAARYWVGLIRKPPGTRSDSVADSVAGGPAAGRLDSEPAPDLRSRRQGILVTGFLIAFALLLGTRWLWNAWDWQVPAVALSWLIGSRVLRGTIANRTLSPLVGLAALLALSVHLFGAGGIQMPGVVEAGIVVAVCGIASAGIASAGIASERPGRSTSIHERTVLQVSLTGGILPLGMLVLVLFGACLLTATRPVLLREAYIQQGDQLVLDGRLPAALASYREAAASDPLSAEPLWRMAELQYRRWLDSPAAVDSELQRAVELGELARAADPFSPLGAERLGQWCLQKARGANQPDARDWAKRAAEYLADAVRRYPTNARALGNLAQAYAISENLEAARAAAGRALQQEAVNRRCGHADKYLAADVLERLEALAGARTGS